MSKKTIYLIIGLITAAILGVIVLQLRMIRTGMEVNAQKEDEKVEEVLRSAVREIEEREERQIANEADKRTSLDAASSLDEAIRELEDQFDGYILRDRISSETVRQVMAKEMNLTKLDGELRYGIYDNRRKEFILRDGRGLSALGGDTTLHKDLLQSGHRASLFGNEDPHGYLMAFAPRKDQVVLQSIAWNLVLSLLFVVIILGCFIYTIYTILLQNKLSVMKTDFINNMTHEFKTPIATISLATDSLRSPRIAPYPEKVARFVNIIKQENKRMNAQVEKVLQMAKLDKNELRLNLTEVNMNEVVADAAEYISLQVEPRGGKVETRLEADPASIEGDLTHVSSLVNNLLDNANKYSPEEPHIIVSTRNVSKGVELTVTDHGLGMSREARKNIFDRFYRVNTGDRHDVKGFGLGLSYVKTITEVHHGSINVKSELGKGSSFIITFPYRQPA